MENFCDHSGMEISVSKSAYTCNNTKLEISSMYKGKTLTKLKNYETYCYLEIEIGCTLNWSKQMKILENKFKNHIKFLKWKRITTQQKITIINIISNTKITYCMNVINFLEE